MKDSLKMVSLMELEHLPGVRTITMKVGNRNIDHDNSLIIPGTFSAGSMTGVGQYHNAGAVYDSSSGIYYPDYTNKEEFFEAHFDGKTLRYKKPQPAQKLTYGVHNE